MHHVQIKLNPGVRMKDSILHEALDEPIIWIYSKLYSQNV